jgi:hypothetical protein
MIPDETVWNGRNGRNGRNGIPAHMPPKKHRVPRHFSLREKK